MTKNKSKEEAASATPKVVLRTYRETDYDQVEFLFRSTQVPLVYESIRSKIWAPITWLVWFAVYTLILLSIPKVTFTLVGDIPGWAMTVLKTIATFCWAVLGITILFISSDLVEIQNRIDEAMANDLKDPDLYYLNYEVKNGKKVRKSEIDQVPSHFWVLTLDDEVCGMIGLSCNAQNVEDQRETVPVSWKLFIVAVFELLRLSVPAFLEKQKPNLIPGGKRRVFAHQQIPKTATITRWAVRSELQSCGFSTLLINRAITWCQEHEINRVYALTDETSMAAEQILVRRHGFICMKRSNTNFFGEYHKLFGCRVNEWIEKNGEKTRKAFKKNQ
jgi:GNAT superfamily N-acetyltransferase